MSPLRWKRRAVGWLAMACSGALFVARHRGLQLNRDGRPRPASREPAACRGISTIGVDLSGRQLPARWSAGPTVLLFFCGCPACQAIGGFLCGPGRAVLSRARIVTVASMSPESARHLDAEAELPGVIVPDPSRFITARFGVQSCPRAVVLDSDGDVRKVIALDGDPSQASWQLGQAIEGAAKNCGAAFAPTIRQSTSKGNPK